MIRYILPNIHLPKIEYATFKGKTSKATVKSATAREIIKKFCTILRGL